MTWNNPTPPEKPKRGLSGTKVFFAVLGAILVAVLLFFGGCSLLVNDAVNDYNKDSKTSQPKDKDKPSKGEKEGTGNTQRGADDVAVGPVKADHNGDRVATITYVNSSSKNSDYYVTFGYYDEDGKRIGEDFDATTEVEPGQESKGKLYVTDPEVVSVKVLSVERTASLSTF